MSTATTTPPKNRLRFVAIETKPETPAPIAAPEKIDVVAKRVIPIRQGRTTANDKLLVGATKTDVNALLPLRFPHFRDLWEIGMKNNWTPKEVQMTLDIQMWNRPAGAAGSLTEDERRMVKINMGFFATAESLIGNNVALGLLRYINNPEARQALWRLGFEESIHNETFMYIVESLGLNEAEIYNMYHELPSVQLKDQFLQDATAALADQTIDTDTAHGKKAIFEALIAQMIMEGVLFYSGFVMILNLKRNNKMNGIGDQYRYIMRDETVHMMTIREIFNHLKNVEWAEFWTPELEAFCIAKFKEAVELETAYAQDCLPRGVLGLRAEMFIDYVQYLVDRRLELIGIPKVYGSVNPFPWLSEMVDLKEDTNFFEGKVTNYQSGGLSFE